MDAALSLLLQAEAAMAEGYDEMRLDWETKLQTVKATREAWEADVKASVKERHLCGSGRGRLDPSQGDPDRRHPGATARNYEVNPCLWETKP